MSFVVMRKLGSLKCLTYRFYNILKLNLANQNVSDLLTLEKMPFYAVAKGRTPGIFMKWNDCEAQVKGFSGARYKKFDTVEAAQQFINLEGGPSKLPRGWKRKGWKLKSGEPVKNEIDFKDLDSVQNQIKIKWNYVEAHRGIHGNEMADQLAKEGAAMYSRNN